MSDPFTVRFANAATGEVKDRRASGVDREVAPDGSVSEWPWEETSLALALALVPDLLAAIEDARRAGRNLDVHVGEVQSRTELQSRACPHPVSRSADDHRSHPPDDPVRRLER